MNLDEEQEAGPGQWPKHFIDRERNAGHRFGVERITTPHRPNSLISRRGGRAHDQDRLPLEVHHPDLPHA
jgi:hypothetical protein